MNEAMMAELERLLMGLEADATVRVVILTGAGRAFSSGGDQKRERDAEGQQRFFDGDLGGGVIERLNRCVLRLQRLAKPVIGSINGVAVGAGCNIALAADVRLASDAARFGEVFTRVGLVPDGGGTYFLPRLVGTAKAVQEGHTSSDSERRASFNVLTSGLSAGWPRSHSQSPADPPSSPADPRLPTVLSTGLSTN